MRRRYLSSPHGVRRFGIHERGALAQPRMNRPGDADPAGQSASDGESAERAISAAPRSRHHDD